MAPSAEIPARLDQEAPARAKLEARCSELSKIRITLEAGRSEAPEGRAVLTRVHQ